MPSRPLFRLQALLLVALTFALASGLPSHHHERSDAGPILFDAGHHGHGTQLVEQDHRLISELAATALPSLNAVEVHLVAPTFTAAPVPNPRPVARGQPPPSDRPRAPPVSV